MWESLDATIATVNNNGIVTGIKVGSTKVVASNNIGQAECVVNVVESLSELSISTSTLNLDFGDSYTLVVDNKTSETPTFSSSNDSVAIVDQTGTITAVGVGQAEISVSISNCVVKCLVNVVAKVQTIVQLNTVSFQLVSGGSYMLTAQILNNEDGNELVWECDNDKLSITKSENSLFVQTKEGQYGKSKITATCGNATATCEFFIVSSTAEKLFAPTLTTSIVTVNWNGIDNAASYMVKEEDTGWTEVTDNFYEVAGLDILEEKTVFVKAVANDSGLYLDSDISTIKVKGEMTLFKEGKNIRCIGLNGATGNFTVMCNNAQLLTQPISDELVVDLSTYDNVETSNIQVVATNESGVKFSNTILYSAFGAIEKVYDFENSFNAQSIINGRPEKYELSVDNNISYKGTSSLKLVSGTYYEANNLGTSSEFEIVQTVKIPLPSGVSLKAGDSISYWVYIAPIANLSDWTQISANAALTPKGQMNNTSDDTLFGYVPIGKWHKVEYKLENEDFAVQDDITYLVFGQRNKNLKDGISKKLSESVSITSYIDELYITSNGNRIAYTTAQMLKNSFTNSKHSVSAVNVNTSQYFNDGIDKESVALTVSNINLAPNGYNKTGDTKYNGVKTLFSVSNVWEIGGIGFTEESYNLYRPLLQLYFWGESSKFGGITVEMYVKSDVDTEIVTIKGVAWEFKYELSDITAVKANEWTKVSYTYPTTPDGSALKFGTTLSEGQTLLIDNLRIIR